MSAAFSAATSKKCCHTIHFKSSEYVHGIVEAFHGSTALSSLEIFEVSALLNHVISHAFHWSIQFFNFPISTRSDKRLAKRGIYNIVI